MTEFGPEPFLPLSLQIECAPDDLMAFFQDFANFSHIIFSSGTAGNIYFIAFDHAYPIMALREFAKKKGCIIEELTLKSLEYTFRTYPDIRILSQLGFERFTVDV